MDTQEEKLKVQVSPSIGDKETSTLRGIANETIHLAHLVTGLRLRGSIPQALRSRYPSGLQINDIDLLVIASSRSGNLNAVHKIFEAIETRSDQYPLLFGYRRSIKVDVRTSQELADATSWYEWALCRADSFTVDLPFAIPHRRNRPELADLIDYMEYLAYIGARSYFLPNVDCTQRDSVMLRKVQKFLRLVAPRHFSEVYRATTTSSDPLDSFERLIAVIFDQATTIDIRRRVTNLGKWVARWREERQSSSAPSPDLAALTKWRTEGKPWVRRDIESRVIWSEHLDK